MQRRSRKIRVTVSIPEEIRRELDRQAEAAGMNRSEAVEEAVTEWVVRRVEEDQERIGGLSRRLEEHRRELEERIELTGQEIAEMLRYQFRALAELSGDELERRAREALRRRRWRR